MMQKHNITFQSKGNKRIFYNGVVIISLPKSAMEIDHIKMLTLMNKPLD